MCGVKRKEKDKEKEKKKKRRKEKEKKRKRENDPPPEPTRGETDFEGELGFEWTAEAAGGLPWLEEGGGAEWQSRGKNWGKNWGKKVTVLGGVRERFRVCKGGASQRLGGGLPWCSNGTSRATTAIGWRRWVVAAVRGVATNVSERGVAIVRERG